MRRGGDSGGSGSSGSDGTQSPERAAVTDYERQRLERIAENRARLAALGLPALASAALSTNPKPPESGGKRKSRQREERDEEEEYCPSGDDDTEDDDEDEETKRGRPGVRGRSKKKSSSLEETSSRIGNVPLVGAEFLDDDEALQQAIALSLAESQQATPELNPLTAESRKTESSSKKKTINKQDSSKTRQAKRTNKSRVQLTEDEVVAFFFMFDETGKGFITQWDLERMANIHDFTWTDSEIFKMINCFSTKRDGKITMEEFRTIVNRCGMLQEPM